MDDVFKDRIVTLAGPLRQQTMLAACVIAEPVHGIIVETGCFRGNPADGQSTQLLSEYAQLTNRDFISFDVNGDHVEKAKATLAKGNVVCKDSIDALRSITENVALAYLDSLDWLEDNPLPSQLHQAMELCAIYNRLISGSVVICDDSGLLGGGKCRLTNKLMAELGMNLAATGYQEVWQKP